MSRSHRDIFTDADSELYRRFAGDKCIPNWHLVVPSYEVAWHDPVETFLALLMLE